MDNNEDVESFFTSEPVEEPANEATDTVVETNEEPTTEAETEPAEEPTTAEAVEPGQKMVPLAALQKQRETTADWKARFDALEQQIAQLKPKEEAPKVAAPVTATIPDPYDQPEEYTRYIQQQIADQAAAQAHQVIFQNNLATSLPKAHATYGKEYCDQVADWFGKHVEQNPQAERELMSQADPAQWVIDLKKRHDMVNSIMADPDAYVRARAVELGLANVAPATAATPTPAKRPTGPASLVNANSANADVPLKVQQEDLFDQLFKK